MSAAGGKGPIALVHLSDIHFRMGEFGEEERNAYLRGELERDLIDMTNRLGPATAVLVTGDVVFAGQSAEYEIARNWLQNVAEIVEAEPTSVMSVPGNHDIARDRIGEAGSALRDRLRNCDEHEIDPLLDRCLAEADLPLLSPLKAYNDFAALCNCSIGRRLSWETELPLPAGYRLAVRGATTVVGSDNQDRPGSLVVGSNQLLFDARDPSRVHAMLAHHDSFFWRDRQRLEQRLAGRVALQLYGHTHEARERVIDGGLVVTAGATQPEEGAGWQPTYNWIVLDVTLNPSPMLIIDVWRRRFRGDGFVSDSRDESGADRYPVALEPISHPPSPADVVAPEFIRFVAAERRASGQLEAIAVRLGLET
jgi:predicted phosphodiesterase